VLSALKEINADMDDVSDTVDKLFIKYSPYKSKK
jgi:hypothetical protein